MPSPRPTPLLRPLLLCLVAVLAVACDHAPAPVPGGLVAAKSSPDRDDGVSYVTPSRPVVRAKSGGGPQKDGAWSAVQDWPLIPLHAALLPGGRLLTYGTDGDGRQTGYFIYDVWTPSAGFDSASHLTLPNTTATDIFCSAQLLLPPGTGEMLLTGGDNWTGHSTTNNGNDHSNVFRYSDDSLTPAPQMNRKRWYGSATMLVNGEVFIQGGEGGVDRPEIRATDGTFRLLDALDTSALGATYPRNFVMADGRIFGFDVTGYLYWIDPAGPGSLSIVGRLPSGSRSSEGSAAMFRPGRILQVGGQSATAVTIDATGGGAPTVTLTPPMSSMRRNVTATILADGSVLATGGSEEFNQLIGVNTIAERYDPRTGQWTQGAAGSLARLYHSMALLLPDATVLVGGGGAPGPLVNKNVEIYSPPYLYAADGSLAPRPVIASAPDTVTVGHSFTLQFGGAATISRVALLKTGSVTHSVNMDQRFLELPFQASGTSLNVDLPDKAGDTPPGYYMVFVFDDHGVPSIARFVWIDVAAAADPTQAPAIARPADRSDKGLVPVTQAVQATDPNGNVLRYGAGGLPPGLAINASTGVIGGSAQQSGTYYPAVSVSDGTLTATARFVWIITSDTPVTIDPMAPPAPVTSQTAIAYTTSGTGVGVQYQWNFGDGTPATDFSSSPDVTHVFALPGLYTIVTTSRDSGGNASSTAFQQVVYLPPTARRPTASSGVAFETRAGAAPRVWVVNPDNDSVSVFDAASGARAAEIPVGLAPRSVAIDAAGKVWVANLRSSNLSIIDPDALALFKTVALPRGSQPYAVAMSPVGDLAYVALAGTGQVVKYKTAKFAKQATTTVGPDVRNVSVAADGATAWVTRFITPPQPGESTADVETTAGGLPTGGEIVRLATGNLAVTGTTVLRHSEQPDFENQGRGVPNYLGAMAISPDGTQAWVPSKQDDIERGTLRDGNNLNFQNTVRAIASRVVMATGAEDPAARLDLDNASKASAAIFDRLGVFLFVALETSREVAVIDAHRRIQLFRFDVGRAPQGLALSADGRTLYVGNFMDRTLSAFDIHTLEQGDLSVTPLGDWPAVGQEKLDPQVLAGKQFFYDARDPRLSSDRYLSCASCHEDGGQDGRVWDLTGFGEGLRNTIALRGRAGGQGYLHWSNNFDEVQDFEGQIRALAGGLGLMDDADFLAGTRSSPLGDRKTGVSADLDALAAYVTSLNAFDDDPLRAGAKALTAPATAGKALFASFGCGACHGGAAYTTSGPNTLFDVGTLKASSGSRLGAALTGIDIPTLRDAWATPPYLHDGSAATLDAAIRAHAGITIGDDDLARLVAFVQQIGREEAAPVVPAGTGTGLTGSYFNDKTLAGTPVLVRAENIDFAWNASPGTGVDADAFSVRWTGSLRPALSGAYTFQSVSNDGIRVWVNNQLLVDHWLQHANATDTSAPIVLRGGQPVPVVVEYYDNAGGATAKLRWMAPADTGFVAVPKDRLFPN